MTFAFPPADRARVSIQGSADEFPVHRIYCVGQNYAKHAREMGADPQREPPFFFCKPADAIVSTAAESNAPVVVSYPSRTADFHHEIELVVALGSGGRDIHVDQAWSHVFGLATGIDLTRRDLQTTAKAMGRPWETSKSFDHSAPISAIRRIADTGRVSSGAIWLDVNGERRQTGDLGEMTWNVAEIIAELSTYFELKAGDLVFTGTPSGIGPVQRGDRLEGGVDGVAKLAVRIE